jgi:hypothetical protein
MDFTFGCLPSSNHEDAESRVVRDAAAYPLFAQLRSGMSLGEGREHVEMPEPIPVARDEARAGSVDFEERAEAVVFEFEEPVRMVKRGGPRFARRGATLGIAGVMEMARFI